jgi:lysophospholipase L1-like esterase
MDCSRERMTNFFLFFNLWWPATLRAAVRAGIRNGLLMLALVLTGSRAAAAPLTNIFYLGDSYLDDGNFEAISKNPLRYFSNSEPWPTLVNRMLGLPAVGRWTAAGGHSPFGNNYAVGGAGINYPTAPRNTSLHGQVTTLLADYPHGLPANSLVVIAIGTNDVIAVLGFGGVWSTRTTSWKLGSNEATVPAANSSVTVPVTSTAGMKPGPANFVMFSLGSGPLMLALTQVNAEAGTVTLTNKYAAPGAKIPAGSSFEVCGQWFIEQEWPVFRADIKSIEADRGRVVLVFLPPTDLLPNFNRQPSQASAHETWQYLYDKMRSLASEDTNLSLTFDLKPVFEDVFADPAKYGFKFNYPGWRGSNSTQPNDYLFWDELHPSGAMHQYVAGRFLEFLRSKGLVK